MKIIYPSKNFMKNIKLAFDARDTLEISIHGGWRGKILAKEVGLWLPVNEIGLMEKGPWRGAFKLVRDVYDFATNCTLYGDIRRL